MEDVNRETGMYIRSDLLKSKQRRPSLGRKASSDSLSIWGGPSAASASNVLRITGGNNYFNGLHIGGGTNSSRATIYGTWREDGRRPSFDGPAPFGPPGSQAGMRRTSASDSNRAGSIAPVNRRTSIPDANSGGPVGSAPQMDGQPNNQSGYQRPPMQQQPGLPRQPGYNPPALVPAGEIRWLPNGEELEGIFGGTGSDGGRQGRSRSGGKSKKQPKAQKKVSTTPLANPRQASPGAQGNQAAPTQPQRRTSSTASAAMPPLRTTMQSEPTSPAVVNPGAIDQRVLLEAASRRSSVSVGPRTSVSNLRQSPPKINTTVNYGAPANPAHRWGPWWQPSLLRPPCQHLVAALMHPPAVTASSRGNQITSLLDQLGLLSMAAFPLSMQTGGPFTISATLVPAAVVQPGPPPPPSRPPSRSNQIPPPPPPGSQGQGQMPDVLRLSRRDSHNSLSDRSSTPQTPVLGYDHGNRFCVSGNGNVLNIASLNIGNGPNHSSTTLPGFLPGGHGGKTGRRGYGGRNRRRPSSSTASQYSDTHQTPRGGGLYQQQRWPTGTLQQLPVQSQAPQIPQLQDRRQISTVPDGRPTSGQNTSRVVVPGKQYQGPSVQRLGHLPPIDTSQQRRSTQTAPPTAPPQGQPSTTGRDRSGFPQATSNPNGPPTHRVPISGGEGNEMPRKPQSQQPTVESVDSTPVIPNRGTVNQKRTVQSVSQSPQVTSTTPLEPRGTSSQALYGSPGRASQSPAQIRTSSQTRPLGLQLSEQSPKTGTGSRVASRTSSVATSRRTQILSTGKLI
ncbi:hypothetical protein EMMF5_004217 [Cystobasidiomycetes sp. EMM_F5]